MILSNLLSCWLNYLTLSNLFCAITRSVKLTSEALQSGSSNGLHRDIDKPAVPNDIKPVTESLKLVYVD